MHEAHGAKNEESNPSGLVDALTRRRLMDHEINDAATNTSQ